MNQERFFQARREGVDPFDQIEILRADFGTLQLITLSPETTSRRRLWVGGLSLGLLITATVASFLFGNFLILFALYPAIFIIAAVLSYLVGNVGLASLARRPDSQVQRIRVLSADFRTVSHSIQALIEQDEPARFTIRGRRRRVMEALSRGGFSLPPFR